MRRESVDDPVRIRPGFPRRAAHVASIRHPRRVGGFRRDVAGDGSRQEGRNAPADLTSFTTAVVAFGFVGGHVIDALLYAPREVLEQPLQLFAIWRGQGSFGGFIGATLGAFAWKHFEMKPWRRVFFLDVPRVARRAAPVRILPLADVLLAVFPVAWIFGRMGCALAHDHPGIRAALRAPLAVAAGAFDPTKTLHGPLGIELRFGDTPRYDLGTLELLFTIALAGATVVTWRRPRVPGFYVTLVPLAYAPVRFALDFLRVGPEAGGDVRYGGLTPAQWCCAAIVVLVAASLQYSTFRGRLGERVH